MKNQRVSFLFLFTFTLICCSNWQTVLAQTTVDSSRYYYHAIVTGKDLQTTIQAFDYFESKVDVALKEKDTMNAAYYLELISQGQFGLGLLYESEQRALQALGLLDQLKKKDTPSFEARKRLLNLLGMIYRRAEDYDNSNRFYQQALELNHDFLSKISIVNNIANNYGDQEQYDAAVNYMKDYFEEVVKLPDTLPKATYLDNFGFYQSKIGDAQGIDHMNIALSIKLQHQELKGLFSSYRHLSLYYKDLDELDTAKRYADLAQNIADSLHISDYRLEALKLHLQLQNNPDIHKFIALQSSIEKARKSNDTKFAAIRYNFKENELKLQASELKNEKQRRMKLIYLFAGIIILLLSVIFYVLLRSRHKKEKIQQVFNTETRLSKKIHDELANDMSDIMSYVQTGLDISPENRTQLLNSLEDVYLRTRDISTETGSINFENFPESLKHLLIQHHKEDVKVVINDVNTINWEQVSQHKKLAIYRCLQELMVNMKKHSSSSLVSVMFKSHPKFNEIRYTDDGIGFDRNTMVANGLLNAESRIKDMGGSFTFETSKGHGFKASIVFKP